MLFELINVIITNSEYFITKTLPYSILPVQVLLTHASRWVYVFTEYLINQCTKMLGSIEEFLLDTEPQIETLIKTLSASPSDAAIAPSAYMKLVELFNKVSILVDIQK